MVRRNSKLCRLGCSGYASGSAQPITSTRSACSSVACPLAGDLRTLPHTLTRLVLTVDPKDHYLVRQAVLYDQLQNTVTMSFNRVVLNPGLSDTLFAFTPPKGTAVVPLDIK